MTEPLINGDTTGWVSQHGGGKLSGEPYTKRVPMTLSQTEETEKQCPAGVCLETGDVHPRNQCYLTLHNNVYNNWHLAEGWKRSLIRGERKYELRVGEKCRLSERATQF